LQTRTILRWRETSAGAISVLVSRRRFPGGAPRAVRGDAESAGFASVAASLSRVIDGPTLLTVRRGLSGVVAGDDITVSYSTTATQFSGVDDIQILLNGSPWEMGEQGQ
jgi:hypothetical protein